MQSFTNSFVNLFHCFRPPRARDPLPQCHDGHNRYAIGNDTLSADETFVGFTADANNLLAVEVGECEDSHCTAAATVPGVLKQQMPMMAAAVVSAEGNVGEETTSVMRRRSHNVLMRNSDPEFSSRTLTTWPILKMRLYMSARTDDNSAARKDYRSSSQLLPDSNNCAKVSALARQSSRKSTNKYFEEEAAYGRMIPPRVLALHMSRHLSLSPSAHYQIVSGNPSTANNVPRRPVSDQTTYQISSASDNSLMRVVTKNDAFLNSVPSRSLSSQQSGPSRAQKSPEQNNDVQAATMSMRLNHGITSEATTESTFPFDVAFSLHSGSFKVPPKRPLSDTLRMLSSLSPTSDVAASGANSGPTASGFYTAPPKSSYPRNIITPFLHEALMWGSAAAERRQQEIMQHRPAASAGLPFVCGSHGCRSSGHGNYCSPRGGALMTERRRRELPDPYLCTSLVARDGRCGREDRHGGGLRYLQHYYGLCQNVQSAPAAQQSKLQQAPAGMRWGQARGSTHVAGTLSSHNMDAGVGNTLHNRNQQHQSRSSSSGAGSGCAGPRSLTQPMTTIKLQPLVGDRGTTRLVAVVDDGKNAIIRRSTAPQQWQPTAEPDTTSGSNYLPPPEVPHVATQVNDPIGSTTTGDMSSAEAERLMLSRGVADHRRSALLHAISFRSRSAGRHRPRGGAILPPSSHPKRSLHAPAASGSVNPADFAPAAEIGSLSLKMPRLSLSRLQSVSFSLDGSRMPTWDTLETAEEELESSPAAAVHSGTSLAAVHSGTSSPSNQDRI